MLEEERGDVQQARDLFQKAAQADPRMVHVWQAWGMMEQRNGSFSEARRLFQSAIWACSANKDACRVWQVSPTIFPALAMRAVHVSCERHFEVRESHRLSAPCRMSDQGPCSWQAWAVLESRAGNIGLARSMHSCAVKADPDSDTAWEVRVVRYPSEHCTNA